MLARPIHARYSRALPFIVLHNFCTVYAYVIRNGGSTWPHGHHLGTIHGLPAAYSCPLYVRQNAFVRVGVGKKCNHRSLHQASVHHLNSIGPAVRAVNKCKSGRATIFDIYRQYAQVCQLAQPHHITCSLRSVIVGHFLAIRCPPMVYPCVTISVHFEALLPSLYAQPHIHQPAAIPAARLHHIHADQIGTAHAPHFP